MFLCAIKRAKLRGTLVSLKGLRTLGDIFSKQPSHTFIFHLNLKKTCFYWAGAPLLSITIISVLVHFTGGSDTVSALLYSFLVVVTQLFALHAFRWWRMDGPLCRCISLTLLPNAIKVMSPYSPVARALNNSRSLIEILLKKR